MWAYNKYKSMIRINRIKIINCFCFFRIVKSFSYITCLFSVFSFVLNFELTILLFRNSMILNNRLLVIVWRIWRYKVYLNIYIGSWIIHFLTDLFITPKTFPVHFVVISEEEIEWCHIAMIDWQDCNLNQSKLLWYSSECLSSDNREIYSNNK